MALTTRIAVWIPLVLYSGFIFYLSSGRAPAVVAHNLLGWDKVLHTGAFGVWGTLCGCALARSRPGLPDRWFVVVVAAAGTLYGLSDEIHQAFVKERTADAWDVVADLVGTVLGAAVALAWARCSRLSESPLTSAS